MIEAAAQYFFEVSWEVCNKCGGINTVLKTKAPHIKNYYPEYFVIGPYFRENAEVELNEEEPPAFLNLAFRKLSDMGIFCHYGTWQIRGSPKAILVDSRSYLPHKDEIKTQLWEAFRVDSLFSGYDFEEPVVWSWCVGLLLEAIRENVPQIKIVAQFHEWLSGAAMLKVRMGNTQLATVFTTHATMLGRSLAGSGFDLYGELGKFDAMQKAREQNIMAKHSMEVACANNADVFTTVSEITAIEAEKLLGRKPEVLLLNGIDVDLYPTIEETSIKHVTCRGILREFITYHFFPYYTFDLDENLMFFFASRYEYHNKGMDILVKSLGRLNERMKMDDNARTITVFFWVPMGTRGVKVQLLENKNYYRHIRSLVDMKSNQILQHIVHDFIARKYTSEDSFFEKDFMKEMKKNILSFQRSGNPSVSTHNMDNESSDILLNSLLAEGLDNKKDDKVKVVVYPVYLDGNDGLLNLSYYDAVAGCHLGIFPSYYEPWGYTPLEASAMGISSLTSDLAGFGMFMKDKLLHSNSGIYILPMMNRTFDEKVTDLSEEMYRFASLDHAERVENKINAKYLSNLCDWKHFVKFYIHAHNEALKGVEARSRKKMQA